MAFAVTSPLALEEKHYHRSTHFMNVHPARSSIYSTLCKNFPQLPNSREIGPLSDPFDDPWRESHRRSNDGEGSQLKSTVTICSTCGNRSAAKNQSHKSQQCRKIESVELGKYENFGPSSCIPHSAFCILHPACGINCCRNNQLRN